MTGASADQGRHRRPDRPEPPSAWSSAVGPGGIDYDHGDWADAKLTCGTGPPPPATRPRRRSPRSARPTARPASRPAHADRRRSPRRSTRRPSTTTTFSLTDQGTTTAASRAASATTARTGARPSPDAPRSRPAGPTSDRVRGGATGVADVAGIRLAADVTWTFTTAAAPDTTPPTVTGVHAGQRRDRAGDQRPTPTATFSEAIDPATLTTTTFSLTDQTTAAAVAGERHVRRRRPARDLHADRRARRRAGPTSPASSAAPPASRTSPASASPRT